MRVPLDTLLEEIDQQRDSKKKAELRKLISHFTGFTFAGYREVLKSLARNYAIVPFRDYRNISGPRLILRHDIEGFMAPALRMAKIESKLGIHSTYFVLLSSRLYNPAEKTGFEILTAISRLGHEIGLHYDVSRYVALGRPPRKTLDVELRFLGHLVGKKVTAISRHNPSVQSFSNPFVGMADLMNAYDPEFTVDAHYISDSCKAWYLEDLLYMLVRNPSRVQVCIHPENWANTKLGRCQTLDVLYRQLGVENQLDKGINKEEWMTTERSPLYERGLEVIRKRLF